MEISRRELLTIPAAAALAGAVSTTPTESRTPDRASCVPDPDSRQPQIVPWARKIRRLGQLNMTEHDPVALNVGEWADYWASLNVDAVLVSVTGILAFYQTQVPFHWKGKYLGDRDFFGDCCAAAKKRGIHVIARMSPDLNWEDAVQAHPEWFQRGRTVAGGVGHPVPHERRRSLVHDSKRVGLRSGGDPFDMTITLGARGSGLGIRDREAHTAAVVLAFRPALAARISTAEERTRCT